MLELYRAEDCGYSETARETLTALGVSYVIHNPRTAAGETRNEQTHEELTELGGRDQIPFSSIIIAVSRCTRATQSSNTSKRTTANDGSNRRGLSGL